MSVIVDVQHACSTPTPSTEQLQHWAESALFSVNDDCELSIRLVDEDESAALNQTYRSKSGPTNVLSFPFDAPIVMEPRLLGDIVICGLMVDSEAVSQNKQGEHHWAHMVVHGCLHLLGYDHIEEEQAIEMETLEKTILQSLAINDPYQAQGDNNE